MGINGPTKPNRTGESTPNDVVMTPVETAKWIIKYFKPTGKVLEPCKGDGAFYDLMPKGSDWCEISQGKDFYDYKKKVDWIITNPPFSIYDDFLKHAFEIADNVVFFCPLNKAFKSQKMDTVIESYGGLAEVVAMGGGGKHGFPFGFPVGCLHYKRNHGNNIKWTRNYPERTQKGGQLEFPIIL